MDYRKYNDTYYICFYKGDEVLQGILDLCKKEHITSAIYSGIGGCSSAELQIFDPETGAFETEEITGMLELLSLNGNIICDEAQNLYQHAHAVFSYKKDGVHSVTGGHMKSITIRYVAEIELRPVIGGEIRRMPDPETGTGFWAFPESHE